MVDLTAEDPDGLGVVDENVVDRREWLVTLDWDESRSNTGAGGRRQVSSERLARLSKTGLCDCVVLETVRCIQKSRVAIRLTLGWNWN